MGAEIDDLNIKIEASAEKASKSIDKVISGLEKMQKALGVGSVKSESISQITVASQKAANSMKSISDSASKSMQSISKQTKKATESIQQMQDRIMKSAREKATVEVDFSNTERETKKWEGQLRNAQNALSRIITTESALSQAKGIERYSAKIAQAELAIKKLNEQTKVNSVSSDIEDMMKRGSKADVKKTLEDYENDLQDFDSKIVDLNGYEQFNRSLQLTFESLKSNFPNAKDTISGYEELIQEVNEAFSGASSKYGKVDTTNIKDYIDGIEKQKSKISSSVGNFAPVQLEKGQSYTKEYADLQKQIDSTSAKISRLIAKQEKFDALGVKTDSQKYKSLQYDLQKASESYKNLTDNAKNLEKSNKAIESSSQKTNRLSEASKKAAEGTSVMANALRTLGAGKAASTLQKVSRNFSDISKSSDQADNSMSKFKKTIIVIGAIGASVAVAIKAFKKLASAVGGAVGKITSGLRKILLGVASVTSGFIGISKGGQFVAKNIHRAFMALASRLRSMAITATTDNMGDSFEKLSKHSQRLGTNMAQLKATLATIGAQFVAAFEPILSFVVPALTTLSNGILSAINALSQLIASLTGQSTYVKATANVNAYKNATSGAAKAQKELNKQLQGVDELNNLTTNNKSGGGSGSGGAGNGVDYTDEKVPASIENLAEKIKKAWENADFTEIGSILAGKLADALDKIDWSKIQENAAKVGKSLATLINGFIEFPELSTKIGNAIGQAVNTVVTGLDAFLSNIHFGSIGTFIGTGISTALQTIDWKTIISDGGKIGKGIADFINSLVNTDVLSDIAMATANLIKAGVHGAYKFVTNLDFGNLGEKIGDSINTFFNNMGKKNADTGKTGWEELGVSISESLSGITETISTAIKKINREDITNAISQILDNIDKEKIKNGFVDVVESSLKLITGKDFKIPNIDLGTIAVSVAGFNIIQSGLNALLSQKIASGIGSINVPITAAISLSISAAIIGFKIGNWLYDNVKGIQSISDGITEWIMKDGEKIAVAKTISVSLAGLSISLASVGIAKAVGKAIGKAIGGKAIDVTTESAVDLMFDAQNLNATSFGEALKTSIGKIANLGSKIASGVGTALSKAGNVVWTGLSSLASSLVSALGTAISGLSTVASTIASAVGSALSAAGTFLTSSVSTVFTAGAASIAAGLFAAIGAAIAGWKIGQLIYDKFSEQIDSIVFAIGDFFTKTIPNALSSAGKAVVDLAVNVKGNIDEKAQQIKDWFAEKKDAAKDLVANVKADGADKLKDVKEQWNGIKKGTKKLKVKFKDSVSKKLKKVKDAWDSVVEKSKKLSVSFTDNFTAPIKRAWNSIARSINNLVDKIPYVGKKISDVPTFKGYANGGYPQKYSLFMAGENGIPEIAGTVGGKTAVAGGAEITGIRDAIYSTSQQEMEYLREQNQLLQGILAKEFGISKNDIGKASRSYARDYYNRTGKEAYSF